MFLCGIFRVTDWDLSSNPWILPFFPCCQSTVWLFWWVFIFNDYFISMCVSFPPEVLFCSLPYLPWSFHNALIFLIPNPIFKSVQTFECVHFIVVNVVVLKLNQKGKLWFQNWPKAFDWTDNRAGFSVHWGKQKLLQVFQIPGIYERELVTQVPGGWEQNVISEAVEALATRSSSKPWGCRSLKEMALFPENSNLCKEKQGRGLQAAGVLTSKRANGGWKSPCQGCAAGWCWKCPK